MNILLIAIGKFIAWFSKVTNLGGGSTWPGHIAILLNPNFIKQITKNSKTKIIFIAGTNGKTTTGKIIFEILKGNGRKVFQNTSGANLLNGLASCIIQHAKLNGKIGFEYAIFEVDENALPASLQSLSPHVVICLNLFRDQLDRYGELDSIAKNWKASFENLRPLTTVLLNADDPLIATLGDKTKAKVVYFGIHEENNSTKMQHASDSIYCPNCSTKLSYKAITYSHLGNWICPKCGLKRPTYVPKKIDYPMPGTYNKYNAQAAVTFAINEGFSNKQTALGLASVSPAFGRQEIIEIEGKKAQIFLSKNPTSFNQSLDAIKGIKDKTVLFVLNDRIPDGRDVSWIWDIAIEDYLEEFRRIIISGDRAYDMALRVNYSMEFPISNFQFPNKYEIETNLTLAIKNALKSISLNETLYILPTYSAMLEVRKILTGRKIL